MRWAASVLVAGLVAGAALGGPAGPASAVPDGDAERLFLSVDGNTWAPVVTAPLLDPGLVWVPGDVATGTLYARNGSGEAADVAVTVRLDGGPAGAGLPLADALDVRTRLGDGAWTDGPVSAVTSLAPGEELPIGVEVGFDPAAGSSTQDRTVHLDLVVTLWGVGPGAGDGGAGGGAVPGAGGPGTLPRTGANLLLPTLLAAAAVVLGVLLRKGARRG
ncbi:hypothetical protein [Promicromonospora sp. NPDC050880]|uniref:hypothetical protein n=1 Tax=Promicromonospora sp. NPDC050880 TaxID=3364406 RepID=UPI00378FB2B7